MSLLDAASEVVRLGNQPGLDDDEWETAFTELEQAVAAEYASQPDLSEHAVIQRLLYEQVALRLAAEKVMAHVREHRLWVDAPRSLFDDLEAALDGALVLPLGQS